MPASITLVGRIVHSAETKQAGSSTVTKVRVPSDVGFGDRKTTTWWNIEMWGVHGERLAKHSKKGDVLFFSGEPCVREYEKSDGSKGFSPEIKNASWSFVPRPSESYQQQQQEEQKPTPVSEQKTYDPLDNDLPF